MARAALQCVAAEAVLRLPSQAERRLRSRAACCSRCKLPTAPRCLARCRRRGPERDAELAAVYEDLLAKFPTAVRLAPFGGRHHANPLDCSLLARAQGAAAAAAPAAPLLLPPRRCFTPPSAPTASLHAPPPPARPQAGYWREYADHTMAGGAEAAPAVKAVFSRCLLTCLSVDLWRAYLNFIKRVRCAVLCCAALRWAALGCAALRWAALGWAALGCAGLRCAVLCCAALRCAVAWEGGAGGRGDASPSGRVVRWVPRKGAGGAAAAPRQTLGRWPAQASRPRPG